MSNVLHKTLFEDQRLHNANIEGPHSVNFPDLISTLHDEKLIWRSTPLASLHLSKRGKGKRAAWRIKLGETLDCTPVHILLLVAVLIELVATTVDIVKTLQDNSINLKQCARSLKLCECNLEFETENYWNFLRTLSICDLCTLLLHILGLLLAFGLSFFRHAGYILDLLIVSTALILETNHTKAAGLVMILNLWRMIMIAHGIIGISAEAWKTALHKAEKQVKVLKAKSSNEKELIIRMKYQILELEEKLQRQPTIVGPKFMKRWRSM